MYEKILDLPHPGQITATPSESHASNGVIGLVNTNKSKNKSSKSTSHIINLPDSMKGDSSLETSADIHVIDSSTAKYKTGNKNKGKNKIKQTTSHKYKTEKNESADEKWKPRYPCLICDEDHYTKECPHRPGVSKFVKGSPTPVVLKDPFPTQDRKMIRSSSNSFPDILMMSEVMVATRSQDYGTKFPVTSKETQNSSQTPAISSSIFYPLHIEKPNPDLVIKSPAKGVLQKSAFNPHARAA